VAILVFLPTGHELVIDVLKEEDHLLLHQYGRIGFHKDQGCTGVVEASGEEEGIRIFCRKKLDRNCSLDILVPWEAHTPRKLKEYFERVQAAAFLPEKGTDAFSGAVSVA
jgi:hypothetical protein